MLRLGVQGLGAPRRAAPVAIRSFWAAKTEKQDAPAEATTVRREAYRIIKSSSTPIHTKTILQELTKVELDARQQELLTANYLKRKILHAMKDARQIQTVAFKVEGKKRAQFGWVAGERVPSFAKSTESEAAAGAQQ